MVKITLRNGNVVTWGREDYTDYEYDGKCFIFLRENRAIGIYNMDFVISVTVTEG